MTKKEKPAGDTITFTPEEAKAWLRPPFQRPLRVTPKVLAASVIMRENGGVIPGVLSFGIFDRKRYLYDGQHRKEAFLLSGCAEGIADIRVHSFDSMAAMGEEYVSLNSRLVSLRPDDVLRGLEGALPQLLRLRKECPFVGYDMVRRGGQAAVVSMSSLIRCWHASSFDVPNYSGASVDIIHRMTEEDVTDLVCFLNHAHSAWGRDPEHYRLWSGLPLALCMWLYRRIVIRKARPLVPDGASRTEPVTLEQFRQCLMSLSADADFDAWLFGRKMTERDRSPCYQRIKIIFAARLRTVRGSVWKLPQPAWGHTSGKH